MACEHEHFKAQVDVNRITVAEGGPVAGFYADVRVCCNDCDEPMVFRGLPIGMGQGRPHMSVDGTEARLPILPQSADPHFGLGLAGFAARVRESLPESEN
jgi:hypothetical protein